MKKGDELQRLQTAKAKLVQALQKKKTHLSILAEMDIFRHKALWPSLLPSIEKEIEEYTNIVEPLYEIQSIIKNSLER